MELISLTPVGASYRVPGMDDPEDRATTNDAPYPQLNLNTGMSLATVVLLLGFGGWIFSIKGDVGQHADRIVSAETSIRELRAAADTSRDRLYQAQITLEGRLVGIEVLLRDVIARLERGDRQRQQ